MPNNHLTQRLAHTFYSYFLLRQFFPKQMPLHKVTEKERFKATDLMNNRPGKCLGYTLMAIFSHALGIDHNINPSVAIMG